MSQATYKDPVRSINSEILNALELVSDHVYPLPGGTGRRVSTTPDSRLSKLQGVVSDRITYYEHVASVRNKKTGTFYVLFRETPDALFARSQDLTKYPEWLMKTTEKLSECQVFVYQVYRHTSEVAVLTSFEDWLTPITDQPELFDTIVYFLGKAGVVTAREQRSYV